MQQVNGLLSKISDRQYRLLTIDGEYIINGSLPVADGFYSNIDLSKVSVRENKSTRFSTSEVFVQRDSLIESTDCPSDCVPPDDCSNPNDCDCDCAEP